MIRRCKTQNIITPVCHKEATLDHYNQQAALNVCEYNTLSLPSWDEWNLGPCMQLANVSTVYVYITIIGVRVYCSKWCNDLILLFCSVLGSSLFSFLSSGFCGLQIFWFLLVSNWVVAINFDAFFLIILIHVIKLAKYNLHVKILKCGRWSASNLTCLSLPWLC